MEDNRQEEGPCIQTPGSSCSICTHVLSQTYTLLSKQRKNEDDELRPAEGRVNQWTRESLCGRHQTHRLSFMKYIQNIQMLHYLLL